MNGDGQLDAEEVALIAECVWKLQFSVFPRVLLAVGSTYLLASGRAEPVLYATGVRVRDYPITLDKLIDRLPDSV